MKHAMMACACHINLPLPTWPAPPMVACNEDLYLPQWPVIATMASTCCQACCDSLCLPPWPVPPKMVCNKDLYLPQWPVIATMASTCHHASYDDLASHGLHLPRWLATETCTCNNGLWLPSWAEPHYLAWCLLQCPVLSKHCFSTYNYTQKSSSRSEIYQSNHTFIAFHSTKNISTWK